jgi:hypothetical protein
MKTLFAILFICISVNAQSQEALRKKYGPPISETLTIRTGVFVTVSYAETGDVCEMIIHPQQITLDFNSPITETMQSTTLTEIIDEVVPKSQRGKLIIGTFLNIVCLPLNNCFGSMSTYERVTIMRIGGDDKERYARIRWEGRACRK